MFRTISFVVCLCLVFIIAANGDNKAPQKKEVKIDVISKPSDCSLTAAAGDTLLVHYTGKLASGKQFDSSVERGEPLEVKLGAGKTIPGFEQGLLGMCVREQRKVTIPPELGYGSKGIPGTIPPGSTLVFTVELVSLHRPSIVRDLLPFLQTISPFLAAIGIGVVLYLKVKQSIPAASTQKQKSEKKRKR